MKSKNEVSQGKTGIELVWNIDTYFQGGLSTVYGEIRAGDIYVYKNKSILLLPIVVFWVLLHIWACSESFS